MKTTNKKKYLSKFLPFLSAAVILSACEKESVVPESDLPAEAGNFISMHFSGQTISQVIKERDDFRVSYEVILDSGTSLDFNNKGECESIEGTAELPDSVVPEEILEYIGQNYSEHHIIKWELDRNEQEVEISNGIELQFDKNGNFLRIDD